MEAEQLKKWSFNRNRILFVVHLTFFIFKLNGQENLIKNPSFESLTCIPANNFDFHCVDDWWNANNNTIDILLRNGSPNSTIYDNPYGYQNTSWGDAFVAILTCARWFNMSPPFDITSFAVPEIYGYSNYQVPEVLGGTLKKPLIKDKKYYLEFYVNVPDNSYFQNDPDQSFLATNSLDFYILKSDTINLSDPNEFSKYGRRVYQNVEILRDTSDWLKMSSCFLAEGNEKYFAVGAIRDTNEIAYEESISWGNQNSVVSILYLDNFYLIECPTCCPELFSEEQQVYVMSNPSTAQEPAQITVWLYPNTEATLEIYDSFGRLVARRTYSEQMNTFSFLGFAAGMYHFTVQATDGLKEMGKVVVATGD